MSMFVQNPAFSRGNASVIVYFCYIWAFRIQICSDFLYTMPLLRQENHPSVIHNFNHASHVSFAGFDVVSLANNHLNDFGSKGANFTVQVLKEAGLKYFGVSDGQFSSSQVSRLDSHKRH